jgi:hypothetical protein
MAAKSTRPNFCADADDAPKINTTARVSFNKFFIISKL